MKICDQSAMAVLAYAPARTISLPMNIFLTGGSGTIGRAVLTRLVERGHKVSALARSQASAALVEDAGAQPLRGDIGDTATWGAAALAGDALIHLANSFDSDAKAAEDALATILKQALPERGSPFRLVYTGGIWLYPDAPPAPLRESVPFAPIPAFAHVAETIGRLERIDALSLAVVHPALVCAPGAGPLEEMAEAARSSQPFVTRAGADTQWPLVEAGDLADLYVRAVESQEQLAVFGCGVEAIAVAPLVEFVAQRLGRSLSLERESPPADLRPDLDIAAGYALSQTVSSETARQQLGWRPRFTDAESLVRALIPAPD